VNHEDTLRRELEAARATIAAQAMRIRQLEEQSRERSGLDVLREMIGLSDVVSVIVGEAPYRRLLEGIVYAARRLFDAGAASIALLDRATEELVFEAASGGNEDIVRRRFPAHEGIAGWVVMTGEPIAVSDVSHDPRFARDFARSTGYVPASILAVPLIVGEDVEGVLEVLDKASAASFGLDDMELLSLFARPAAVAVEQARTVGAVGTLLMQEVRRLAGDQGNADLAQVAQDILTEDRGLRQETLQLALLVHKLSNRGERARRLATEIFTSVDHYLDTR
jgi:GAF domain-containing protein